MTVLESLVTMVEVVLTVLMLTPVIVWLDIIGSIVEQILMNVLESRVIMAVNFFDTKFFQLSLFFVAFFAKIIRARGSIKIALGGTPFQFGLIPKLGVKRKCCTDF
jgi:hypothetical protein